MSEHLTQQQLEQYGSRTLAPSDLLAVDDHLAECDECRAKALELSQAPAAVASLRLQLSPLPAEDLDHPEHEQLVGFIEGTLDVVDKEIVEGHLEFCEDCAAEVAELRKFRAMLATLPRKTYAPGQPGTNIPKFSTSSARPVWRLAPAYAMAAALLIAALVAIKVNHSNSGTGKTSGSQVASNTSNLNNNVHVPSNNGSTGEPTYGFPAPPENGAGKPSSGAGKAGSEHGTIKPVSRIGTTHLANSDMVASNGSVNGSKYGPALPASVKAVLADKHLDLNTPEIKELIGPEPVIGAAMPTFTVDAPVRTAVLVDRPTFTWEPAKDDTGYQVIITDADGNAVTQSQTLPDTTWRPDRALPRGVLLKWQVKAYQNGSVVETEPDGGARFRVLDEDHAEQIREAEKSFADQPLALGILYAQAALLDDAEKAFNQAQKAQPDNTTVTKLLADVKTVRENML